MDVPRPHEAALTRLRTVVRLLTRGQCFRTLDPAEVLDQFKGSRKRRYSKAADLLRLKGWKDAYARVKMFVKAEKFDPEVKGNPDPRAIQFRSFMYGLMLACFIKPMEHSLYELKLPQTLTKGRVMGKGLSLKARADLFWEKFRAFRRPRVVSIDAKRFDAHVNTGLLKVEHLYYTLMNKDPFLAHILSLQLFNKGRTQNGYQYTVKGGRMSGDMNTALGNCLLMAVMILDAMRSYDRWDCLIDGDDCLLFFEDESGVDLAGLEASFLEYGMEIKLEGDTTNPLDVVWCQAHLVETFGGWVWVQNPEKVLSRGVSNTKYMSSEEEARSYCGAVGIGQFASYKGVPILQELALAYVRASEGRVLNLDDKHFQRAFLQVGGDPDDVKGTLLNVDLTPDPITLKTRFDFHRAFSISPAAQEIMEAQLRVWTPDFSFTLLDEAEVGVDGRLFASWIRPQLGIGTSIQTYTDPNHVIIDIGV